MFVPIFVLISVSVFRAELCRLRPRSAVHSPQSSRSLFNSTRVGPGALTALYQTINGDARGKSKNGRQQEPIKTGNLETIGTRQIKSNRGRHRQTKGAPKSSGIQIPEEVNPPDQEFRVFTSLGKLSGLFRCLGWKHSLMFTPANDMFWENKNSRIYRQTNK